MRLISDCYMEVSLAMARVRTYEVLDGDHQPISGVLSNVTEFWSPAPATGITLGGVWPVGVSGSTFVDNIGLGASSSPTWGNQSFFAVNVGLFGVSMTNLIILEPRVGPNGMIQYIQLGVLDVRFDRNAPGGIFILGSAWNTALNPVTTAPMCK